MWFGAGASDMDAGLVTAVWAFLGIVVVTLGNMAIESRKNRRDKATSSTPAVDGSSSLLQVARDVARDIGQLDQRADDNDKAIDMLDRARGKDREDLDDVLDYLDERDPGWRRRD